MSSIRDRNVFGAFALMLGDDIVRAASSFAPEAGPAAAALALLDHEPGLSIRTLAVGVGLSHAGTVRLVDRLVADGLVERRGHATDGRARSLHLTAAGEKASAAVLHARDQVLARGLATLSADELATLTALSERVLRACVRDVDHAYHICRLCGYASCADCPIEDELRQRKAI
ncbi:MarR family transcriptional regulator [Azospirillum sp. SYSU D00513]|uniref:MarR family winged helix-turn-helix transcriptional regulator n=1 Tax=Azospirillum sp. SYSU D00513 TaxID=2812561 RepID=UPI001FFEE2B0|nr:MarR family transcriptional regulator [Azospirillum sp. SYSU D00513]